MILYWRPNGTAGPPTAFSIGVGLVNAWMAGSSTPSTTEPSTGFTLRMRARQHVLAMRQREHVLTMKPRA